MNVHPKVSAATTGAGIGYSLGLIIGWVLGLAHVSCPSEVSNALGIVLATVCTFIAGYFTPDKTVPPTTNS